jgi:hypothetical protein
MWHIRLDRFTPAYRAVFPALFCYFRADRFAARLLLLDDCDPIGAGPRVASTPAKGGLQSARDRSTL